MDPIKTIPHQQPEISLPGPTELEQSTRVLHRLTSEWRSAWGKLGLSNGTTIVDVAKRLDIDRGTAQRLNRIAKLSDAAAANVGHFPGVRAWQRVLLGMESALGSDHPSYQNLVKACDDFAKWLDQMGGSRSAAMRQIGNDDGASDQQDQTSKSTPDQHNKNMRETWVQAVIESFGYSVDLRLDLQVMRENPASSPARIDLASVHVLKGCRGNLGALPITFSRSAYSGDRTHVQSSKDGNTRSFHVLESLTSKPAPVILTTVDAQRQTIFVEPNWTSMRQPLDLAIMHEEPEALLSSWHQKPEGGIESATVNRHPNRKLVMERVVTRYVDSKCTATLRAFRTQMILTQQEPWFDRIPEEATVQRVGTIQEAIQQEIFPGYAAALAEVITRLQWDSNDMILYRAELTNPLPLATYTIRFEPVRS